MGFFEIKFISFNISSVFYFVEVNQKLTQSFVRASFEGDGPAVTEMLEAGVPVDSRDHGWTALHGAAGTNCTDLVRQLLEKGANVNELSNTGMTPLHRAAGRNRTDVMRVLLQYGASTNIKDQHDRTPLDIARLMNREKAIGLLEQY